MPLSSIFSFDSIETVRPRFPKAIVLTLVVVLGAEALTRVLPEKWYADPTGGTTRMEFWQKEVIDPMPPPQVLILGSSRSTFAVAPRIVARELDLPDNDCMNSSMISGTPLTASKLYHVNREKFSQSKLIVVGVDEWHPRLVVEEPLDPSESRLERCMYHCRFSMRERCPLLFGNLLGLMGLRTRTTLNVAVDEENQVWFTPKSDEHNVLTQEQIDSYAHSYYQNRPIQQSMLKTIEKLIADLRSEDAVVVFLWLPNQRSYQDRVDALYGPEYRESLRVVREILDREHVPFLHYKYPEECGMTDTDYSDPVHMRPTGARKFSKFLAETIRKEEWLRRD